jgi:hypothetical protein
MVASDSPDLRLNRTCDGEAIVDWGECWQREFGED